MNIDVDTNEGVRKVRIEGELNIYSAPEFKHHLLDQLDQDSELDIDLSQVTEIDTAGLQALYLVKREALADNKTLRLASHSAAVQELIALYNLAAYFGVPQAGHRAPEKAGA